METSWLNNPDCSSIVITTNKIEDPTLETIFGEFYQSNRYTDLEIILDNGSAQKNMKVHKLILIAKCPYFKKLLGFNGGSQEKSIRIFVEDVDVAHDIILSFYGIINECSDVFYVLSTIKIRDYFCLNNDYKKILQLKVPVEYYGILVEVVNLLGINNELAKLLLKNKPIDYDLEDPSQIIAKNDINYDIVYYTNTYIYIYNTFEEKKLRLYRTFLEERITGAKYSYSAKYVLIVTNLVNRLSKWTTILNMKSFIYLQDAFNGILLKSFSIDELISSFTFTIDELYIIMGTTDGHIKIYNLNGCIFRNIYVLNQPISNLCVSPNGLYLISVSGHDIINIWQLDLLLDTTKNLLKPTEIIFKNDYKLINIVYSPDNKYFCISTCQNIFIYCAKSLQLKLDLWSKHINDDSVQNIAYSPDGSRLLVTTDNFITVYDMLKIYEGDSSTSLLQKILNTPKATMSFYTIDLRHIITNGSNKLVFWDAVKGELLRTDSVSNANIISFSISQNIPIKN